MPDIRRSKSSPVKPGDGSHGDHGDPGNQGSGVHDPSGILETAVREQEGRVDRRRIVGTAILAAMISGGTSSADLLAGWNFNQLESGSDWISADSGRGWMDLGDLAASSDSYEGTDLNALPGWTPGRSLGFQGAEVADGAVLLGASLGGMSPGGALEGRLSFATRRSLTGFDEITIERWSGADWMKVEVLDVQSRWTMEDVVFTFDGLAGDLLLRLDFAGATSGAGTIRIDNLRLETAVAPAPGGLALLGGAAASLGCVGRGRTRTRTGAGRPAP